MTSEAREGGEALPEKSNGPLADSIATRTARAKQASGEAFLRAADKKNTTMSLRVNFLRSKGFTVSEIQKCFEAVGQPISIEQINDAIANRKPDGVIAPKPVDRQSSYHASPYFSPIPPPKEAYGWKDYFVGATVASVCGYGIYKLAASWLPWELSISRKVLDTDDNRREKRRERRSREERVCLPTTPAKEEADNVTAASSAPPENPGVAPSESEVEKLKADLAEKAEQYTKVMREKVELTVKSAQAKAQQAQTARSLENANKRVAELEARISELTAVKSSSEAVGAEVTTPGQDVSAEEGNS